MFLILIRSYLVWLREMLPGLWERKNIYCNKLPAGHVLHDVFQPFVFFMLNFAQGARRRHLIPKELHFEPISIFILSFYGIVQYLMKAKTFKLKREKPNTPPTPPKYPSPLMLLLSVLKKGCFSHLPFL